MNVTDFEKEQCGISGPLFTSLINLFRIAFAPYSMFSSSAKVLPI